MDQIQWYILLHIFSNIFQEQSSGIQIRLSQPKQHTDQMQCPVLPLQRHWLYSAPLPHTSASPAASSPSTNPPSTSSSSLSSSYPGRRTAATLQLRPPIPWITLMPPRPRQSFRKCLSVSSAPESHTGQSTTPSWNL